MQNISEVECTTIKIRVYFKIKGALYTNSFKCLAKTAASSDFEVSASGFKAMIHQCQLAKPKSQFLSRPVDDSKELKFIRFFTEHLPRVILSF